MPFPIAHPFAEMRWAFADGTIDCRDCGWLCLTQTQIPGRLTMIANYGKSMTVNACDSIAWNFIETTYVGARVFNDSWIVAITVAVPSFQLPLVIPQFRHTLHFRINGIQLNPFGSFSLQKKKNLCFVFRFRFRCRNLTRRDSLMADCHHRSICQCIFFFRINRQNDWIKYEPLLLGFTQLCCTLSALCYVDGGAVVVACHCRCVVFIKFTERLHLCVGRMLETALCQSLDLCTSLSLCNMISIRHSILLHTIKCG